MAYFLEGDRVYLRDVRLSDAGGAVRLLAK